MLMATILTLVLMVASVFVHYEILRLLSNAIPRMRGWPRGRLEIVISVAMVAHIIEISLFAVAYWAMQNHLELGEIVGRLEGDWLDYFYFSAAAYSTLGMGDLLPTGPMRLMASVESIGGLVLIGWSASFTYLAMVEFWGLHGSDKKDR